jgi:hypothetical protein
MKSTNGLCSMYMSKSIVQDSSRIYPARFSESYQQARVHVSLLDQLPSAEILSGV